MPHGLTYLAGMSLGCLPTGSASVIQEVLDVWESQAVEGHGDGHKHGRSWYNRFEELCNDMVAPLVGAFPDEVATMGELTCNLNMLLLQFYQPTSTKFKIVMEHTPFPSDKFLVEGHVDRLGLPRDAVIYVRPEEGKEESCTIGDRQIVDLIESDHQIAIVFLSAVNYFSGQFFDVPLISRAARRCGCVLALDLAHAIGNVELRLSEWDVDFAAWCSYKYLNSGPGSIAGIYVNRRHHRAIPVFRGWWGAKNRFDLKYEPEDGAKRFVMSNPSVLSMCGLFASLCLFSRCSMRDIRMRSFQLCNLFRDRVGALVASRRLVIITPGNYAQSGAQLTLKFPMHSSEAIFKALRETDIVTDQRLDCIRVAFVGLYNTEDDAIFLAERLHAILQ